MCKKVADPVGAHNLKTFEFFLYEAFLDADREKADQDETGEAATLQKLFDFEAALRAANEKAATDFPTEPHTAIRAPRPEDSGYWEGKEEEPKLEGADESGDSKRQASVNIDAEKVNSKIAENNGGSCDDPAERTESLNVENNAEEKSKAIIAPARKPANESSLFDSEEKLSEFEALIIADGVRLFERQSQAHIADYHAFLRSLFTSVAFRKDCGISLPLTGLSPPLPHPVHSNESTLTTKEPPELEAKRDLQDPEGDLRATLNAAIVDHYLKALEEKNAGQRSDFERCRTFWHVIRSRVNELLSFALPA